jgi:hypothetical protein
MAQEADALLENVPTTIQNRGFDNYYCSGATTCCMHRRQYYRFLKEHCTPAFKQYQAGIAMQVVGSIVLSSSVSTLFFGSLILHSSRTAVFPPIGYYDAGFLRYDVYRDIYYNSYLPGVFLITAGALMLSGGIAMIVFGTEFKQIKSAETYNNRCGAPPVSFQLKIAPAALGFHLHF